MGLKSSEQDSFRTGFVRKKRPTCEQTEVIHGVREMFFLIEDNCLVITRSQETQYQQCDYSLLFLSRPRCDNLIAESE